MSVEPAELIAARAVGAGVGLLVLMVTWLVGNRVAALFWAPPLGPTIAFVCAIVAGLITGLATGKRLATRVREGK